MRNGMTAAPRPTPASSSSIPATSGPPKIDEMAENEPAVESTLPSRGSARASDATATPTTEPRAISGASGPRTAPNASVPSAASATPGRMRKRRRFHADPAERPVAAVAREERARQQDDARAGGRQPEHEIPGWAGRVETFGKVVPQPVLELVNGGEEQRGEQRGGDTDDGAERDEMKGTPPRNGLVWLGRAHARTVSPSLGGHLIERGAHSRRPSGATSASKTLRARDTNERWIESDFVASSWRPSRGL